ncbi:MAG: NADH-quinone oxidoreductase subunit NuoH [Planctomycetes bacterium]|nr:NADH-quinone oxidoreductase subunit NuoH [Planctomycetota bacterium]
MRLDLLLQIPTWEQLRNGPWVEAAAAIAIVGFVLANLIAVYAGISTLLERKIAGHMQSRVGPYQVGPHGSLQWLADALKLLFKEDVIPRDTDKLLFRMAPYVVFAGSFAAWCALPFMVDWAPAFMNIGILYILAISGTAVVGILMAGWSSGSKWSLFGAMRSAAQIVSYEVPIGLVLLGMLLMYGTLDMNAIAKAQTQGLPFALNPEWRGPWYLAWASWGVFRHMPFTVIAFLVYYTAALAETNRTPFDIPEAESELVAGYHTEYSGMRFSFFFLSEYANMFVVSAIATTFFLGGPLSPLGPVMSGGLFDVFWFLGKAFLLVFVMIWLRWTLPRYRVDQLMDLCWKRLTPLGFICLFAIGLGEHDMRVSVALGAVTFVFIAVVLSKEIFASGKTHPPLPKVKPEAGGGP